MRLYLSLSKLNVVSSRLRFIVIPTVIIDFKNVYIYMYACMYAQHFKNLYAKNFKNF